MKDGGLEGLISFLAAILFFANSDTIPFWERTSVALVTIDTPFVLQIDAPLDQQTIGRPSVLVRGMVMNSTGRETGVTVNGIAALQYDEQFMVNHVPLAQGENTLTITATDAAGENYSVQLTVFADISGQYCKTTALPEMGLAPFSGELQIAAPVELDRSTALDFGPSDVVFGLGPPILLPITIKQPGLYWFEVEAESIDNQIFTDEVAVLVYDNDELDALLRAKWNAMKACLLAGDGQGASVYYNSATRSNYEAIFTALGDQLPQIAQQMQDIELIHAGEGYAKYRIRRDEIIGGETHSITYNIYFCTDENGVWKIDRF